MNRSIRAHAPPSWGLLAAVIAGWLGIIVGLVATLVIEDRLRDAGRPDLVQDNLVVIVLYVAAILSSAIVGSALAIRRPRHPVGWLFLALGVSISLSGVADGLAAYGTVARPGTVPRAALLAVIGDVVFIPWLMILGLIMLLTPTGRLDAPLWRVAGWVVVTSGATALVSGMLRPYRGQMGDGIHNPIEASNHVGVLQQISVASIVILHTGLLLGALSLVVRWWAARDAQRLQLRALGWVALPFSLLVITAWFAAAAGNEVLLASAAGGFLSIIPIAAALAIERHHLYDVERLVSRGLLWLLLSIVLVSCYAIVVVFVGESLGDLGGGSQVPAVVATLVTVSILGPARRFLQDGLDRHFNRRRFDAVATIRRYLDQPSPTVTIGDGLREALGDPTLSVAYWIEDRSRWVHAAGNPIEPGPEAIVLRRHDLPICAIAVDAPRVDRETVETVAREALTELENAQLRAAISLQLVEVRESRARIVAAQLAERRKIERNLHDGAQQRLLALALQLRAAELSQIPGRQHDAMAHAIDQLQVAVQELRELANGLVPSALVGGGLAAALEELASRTPVPVRLCVNGERWPPPIEETAWFIACEAVANAVKHAQPRNVTIVATHEEHRLRLVVEDDGVGGADPAGSGLRGIVDRAEAIGGRVSIGDRPGGGTIVTVELPCVS